MQSSCTSGASSRKATHQASIQKLTWIRYSHAKNSYLRKNLTIFTDRGYLYSFVEKDSGQTPENPVVTPFH